MVGAGYFKILQNSATKYSYFITGTGTTGVTGGK